MKFDVDYLLRDRQLMKIPESEANGRESLRAALSWIKESENNFKNKSFKSCVISSYLAMFHSARAILYLDGFREKTHFAIARYLEDVYSSKEKLEKKWIEILDYYRDLRNSDQYRASFIVEMEEAEKSVETSKKFVKEMERLFSSKLAETKDRKAK